MKLLFVYGTLMRGEKNHAVLMEPGDVRFLGPARCRGVLYDLGEYPGFVPGGRQWVAGEIYRMLRPEGRLPILDAFECSAGFERALAQVRWRHGEESVWAYIYKGPLDSAVPIAGGSYKSRKDTSAGDAN